MSTSAARDMRSIVWAVVAVAATAANAGTLGLDQVVPLEYANQRGALTWSDTTRQSFLRDPNNRMELSAADARQRDGRGPLQWLPAIAQCRYISRFIAVIERYDLSVRADERQALVTQRQRCYTQFQ